MGTCLCSHTKLLAWHGWQVSTRIFVVNKTSFASVENQVSRQSYYFNIRSLDVGWFGFFFSSLKLDLYYTGSLLLIQMVSGNQD